MYQKIVHYVELRYTKIVHETTKMEEQMIFLRIISLFNYQLISRTKWFLCDNIFNRMRNARR